MMLCITALCGWGANRAGIAPHTQAIVAVSTFIAVICTTLFFWTHRVAAAFIGVAVLIGSHAMTLKGMLQATELDIILFLIGMMIIVGALKDLGLLTWIIQSIINMQSMSGPTFVIILCVLSGVLASVVDEVSSIVVVLALVFQVCDTLKVRTTPFILIAVLATNIGSAATMLGNPVGIFIGNKAGFTFSQFLIGATPIAIVSLIATIAIVLIWYRKDIKAMTEAMSSHRTRQYGLGPIIKIPFKRGFFVLVATVLTIAFHHQIENFLGLTGIENKNAFLIVTPLIIAGILMAARPYRARHYVEHDVEWWTLLFFLLLFAIAGSLQENHVTDNLAHKLASLVTDTGAGDAVAHTPNPKLMIPFVLIVSAIGSAFVDNIVFVAAFAPVVQSLIDISTTYTILWWALLFGACFGGNITAIGSTANIVALGMLEKKGHIHIGFFKWLKIGLLVGMITCLIAWLLLLVIPMPAPARTQTHTTPTTTVVTDIESPSQIP